MLFLTYRSIFILGRILENLLDMMRFRGKPSVKNLGNILGFFVIKSIQTGENMYNAMRLRGYDDKKTAG
jgi:energy-coupling factor transporter transmembrane protein EcfT